MSERPDFSPEAIAEAINKATPGPWLESHEQVSDLQGFDCQSQVVYPDGRGNYGFRPADAHLIANAPTWLAQLLAALEASERENEALRGTLEEIAVADARNAPWDGATSLNVARTLASMARSALAPSTPPDLREDDE